MHYPGSFSRSLVYTNFKMFCIEIKFFFKFHFPVDFVKQPPTDHHGHKDRRRQAKIQPLSLVMWEAYAKTRILISKLSRFLNTPKEEAMAYQQPATQFPSTFHPQRLGVPVQPSSSSQCVLRERFLNGSKSRLRLHLSQFPLLKFTKLPIHLSAKNITTRRDAQQTAFKLLVPKRGSTQHSFLLWLLREEIRVLPWLLQNWTYSRSSRKDQKAGS